MMGNSKVKAQFTVMTPSRAMEWTCAGIQAGFACSCLMGPMFETGEQWARFADLGSEREWGAFVGAIALIRIAALLVNGNYRRTPAARAATALLGAGLFAFMSVLFLVPGMTVTSGVFTYGFLCVADLVSCRRAAKDAAIADWIWKFMARPDTQPAALPSVMPGDWRRDR